MGPKTTSRKQFVFLVKQMLGLLLGREDYFVLRNAFAVDIACILLGKEERQN